MTRFPQTLTKEKLLYVGELISFSFSFCHFSCGTLLKESLQPLEINKSRDLNPWPSDLESAILPPVPLVHKICKCLKNSRKTDDKTPCVHQRKMRNCIPMLYCLRAIIFFNPICCHVYWDLYTLLWLPVCLLYENLWWLSEYYETIVQFLVSENFTFLPLVQNMTKYMMDDCECPDKRCTAWL